MPCKLEILFKEIGSASADVEEEMLDMIQVLFLNKVRGSEFIQKLVEWGQNW